MLVKSDLQNNCEKLKKKSPELHTNHKLTIQTGWQAGKTNYKNENNK